MKNTLAATEVSAKSRTLAMRRALLVSCACALYAGLFCCLLLCTGCSKGKHEPRLTGKKSDPPVSLHCAWQPGSRYHLRLDQVVLTDSDPPEPDDSSLHTVSFAQECLVTATNASRSGNVGLDMEILSLAMDRAKGGQFSLSFDSDQGGETTDDSGYIPILTNLVGGHLYFLISPDGKMLRAEGISEWLAHGLGEIPPAAAAPMSITDSLVMAIAPILTGGASTNNPPTTNNAPTNVVRKGGRAIRNPRPASPALANRGGAAGTLRNFLNPDLFRQMLEFNFLPSSPVHVEEEWKTQGDTPITGRGRFRFDETSKFAGWQQRGETNSARVDLHGTLHAGGNAPPAGGLQKTGALTGTLWIDPNLSFPVTTILDKQIVASDTTSRRQGTNNVITKTSAKTVHQNVTINLLDVTPIQAAAK